MLPALLKDVYKSSHVSQYPEGTQVVYSNLTARSNRHFAWEQSDKGYVILWGVQAFIQEYLVTEWNKFFDAPLEEAVGEYERVVSNTVGPTEAPHIEELHKLGYLPVEVKSLPEGSKVPIGCPMLTIKNTHEDFAWVTNMLETLISTELWKPITTATIAYEYRKLCEVYANATCDDREHIPFQCHDFSMRGMSGVHDAACSGTGHLLSFLGTDTYPAILRAEKYYFANGAESPVGLSVPATEHSVMCMGGKSTELETVERLLTETYPTGIFSAVMDTWDFFGFLTEGLPKVKGKVMGRNGKFVVRPDSGDPVKIICGYNLLTDVDHMGHSNSYLKQAQEEKKLKGLREAIELARSQGYDGVRYLGKCYDLDHQELSEAEVKGAIQILWDLFGGHENSKGFKVLDEHIGLIYGDSITLERAKEIFQRLQVKGFASSNVVYGVGSFTYQMITRDTFGMAIKATWGKIQGTGINIQKDPKTDDGTKKSLTGLIRVIKKDGSFVHYDQQSRQEAEMGELKPRFKDGKVKGHQVTLDEVRNTLWPAK